MISFNGTEWVDLDDEIKSGSGSKVNNVYYGSNLVYPDNENIPVPKPIKGYHYYYEFEFRGDEEYSYDGLYDIRSPYNNVERTQYYIYKYMIFSISKHVNLKFKVMSKLPIFMKKSGQFNYDLYDATKNEYFFSNIKKMSANKLKEAFKKTTTLIGPDEVYFTLPTFYKNLSSLPYYVNKKLYEKYEKKLIEAYKSLAFSEPITKITCDITYNLRYSPIRHTKCYKENDVYIKYIGDKPSEWGAINTYKDLSESTRPLSYNMHMSGKNESGVYTKHSEFKSYKKDHAGMSKYFPKLVFDSYAVLNEKMLIPNTNTYNQVLFDVYDHIITNTTNTIGPYDREVYIGKTYLTNDETVKLSLSDRLLKGNIAKEIRTRGSYGSNYASSTYSNDNDVLLSLGYPITELIPGTGFFLYVNEFSTYKYKYKGNFICNTNAETSNIIHHQYLFDKNFERLITKMYDYKTNVYSIEVDTNYGYIREGFIYLFYNRPLRYAICDCFYQKKINDDTKYVPYLLDDNIIPDEYYNFEDNEPRDLHSAYRWIVK